MEFGTDEGQFAVGDLTLEYLKTRADQAFMQQIALRAGGRTWTMEDLDNIETLLENEDSFAPRINENRVDYKLWQLYTFLILLLTLLTAEWVIRKRSGMV